MGARLVIEYRILGPLEVGVDGDVVRLGGRKQRAVLAMLVLDAGRVVSVDRLVDGIWGTRPPATAAKSLQGYVSELRKLLGSDAIITRSPGYLLDASGDTIDIRRFQAAVRAADGEAPYARACALEEALRLWRGAPLADFAAEPFAQPTIRQLEEERLNAIEERIDAQLALGRHAELIGELEALTREHAFRERLWCQLMLALYRADRQADSLEVAREAASALRELRGIDPSRAMRELERAILNQDPGLELLPSRPAAASVATSANPARSEFVGRARELGELEAAVESARSGRGGVVLIGGEPGVGKSRLIEELAVRARSSGMQVLVGRCWEAGGAPVFWPWVQVLRSHLFTLDDKELGLQLGAGAADVARILPELRERLPHLPESRGAADDARFRLFDAVAGLLARATAHTPIVLVLEDIHAADEPSLLLLRFLARVVGDVRLLIVCGYRTVDPVPSAGLEETLADVGRVPITRTLVLAGIGSSDAGRLIALTTGNAPTDALLEDVYARTDGNPLFLVEVARFLAERGPSLGDPDPADVPESVRAVIRRRLQRLSVESGDVLAAAAVLGRDFSLDVLQRVSGVSEQVLLSAVDEASAARLLTDISGLTGRLRFSHALIRDVAYVDVPRARRTELHRRVAAALELLHGTDVEPPLAEIAHHLVEATPVGDTHEAVSLCSQAAHHAALRYAFEEAARLYGMALDLVDRDSRADAVSRCDLLLAMGDVQTRAGDTPASKETFRIAAALAAAHTLPEHHARAALGYGGRMTWGASRDDDHLATLLEGALAALEKKDSPLRARVLARLAGGPLRDSTHDPARRSELSRQALEMARRIGDPATLAYALHGYVSSRHSPEFTPEQLQRATELVQVALQADDPERVAEGHELCFVALFELGRMPEARAALDRLAALADALRQPAQRWFVAAYRALLALLEGRFSEAEHLIADALGLGQRAQSWEPLITYHVQLYILRRAQGRLPEVLEMVRTAAAESPTYPLWRCIHAQAAAELGLKREAAEALAAVARDQFARLPFDEEWLLSTALLAEAAHALDDRRHAATLHALIAPYADRVAIGYPEFSMGSMSLYLGILAATLGRWDQAVSHLEAAVETNARIGARPFHAHAQEHLANILTGRDRRGDATAAHQLRQEAAATRHALGMHLAPNPARDE